MNQIAEKQQNAVSKCIADINFQQISYTLNIICSQYSINKQIFCMWNALSLSLSLTWLISPSFLAWTVPVISTTDSNGRSFKTPSYKIKNISDITLILKYSSKLVNVILLFYWLIIFFMIMQFLIFKLKIIDIFC